MNTNVMKTFCDLVETGSFSKAAETNGISQSAVSQQLASLEREMGTCLVSRGGGFAMPTDAGTTFYQGAKEILQRYEQTLAQMRSAVDTIRGTLRVGTIYSVGLYLLTPCVREFLKAHPEVNLDVEYARWNQITTAVLNNEMDLGIVAFPEKHRSIERISFTTEKLTMVCSPSHRLAKRRQLKPTDLKNERFVAFEANVPTRRYIDRLLKGFRVNVNIVMEFDNIDTVKRAIEVDLGLSILPEGNVEREVTSRHLCSVPFSNPAKWVRKIGIIRRRGKEHSQAEQMFLSVLRSPS